jgi:hypothetical protein
MATEIAKPTYQAVSAKTRAKPLTVTGKLKTVLDRVVYEGADPYEAGRTVGMHARSIRKALAKSHVLAYLRTARQVLREQARAQNIHHMIEMRRSSTNEMAKLGAMKLIEASDDFSGPDARTPVQPGLIIIVNSPRAPAVEPTPVIDVEPAPRAVPVKR